MSAVTAVTAQNSHEISSVILLPPAFVSAQIGAVLSDYGAQAVKSGFIGSRETIQAVAASLLNYKIDWIIIDPVLVNHRGEPMFKASITDAYIENLFPLANLVTPNLLETQLLVGSNITSLSELEQAADKIQGFGSSWVLIKGWKQDDAIVDILYGQGSIQKFQSETIDTANTHGSGDTLSAAICSFLAKGMDMIEAVRLGHKYTNMAIRKAAGWQLGRGHGPLHHGPDNLS